MPLVAVVGISPVIRIRVIGVDRVVWGIPVIGVILTNFDAVAFPGTHSFRHATGSGSASLGTLLQTDFNCNIRTLLSEQVFASR